MSGDRLQDSGRHRGDLCGLPTSYARYCVIPEGVIYGYETADWDSLMPRMMMMKEDALMNPGILLCRRLRHALQRIFQRLYFRRPVRAADGRRFEEGGEGIMNFKKQIFGFMDMLRFKKLVPTRRQMLAQGENKPLPQEYRTNTLAKKLHPGYMQVELVAARPLTETIRELTFKRVDSDAFPFFRAGQYVSLQMKIGDSVVSPALFHRLHATAGAGK